MDLDLVRVRGQWTVASSRATLLNANTVPEDPEIAALVRPAHEKVLTYVNSVIGTCTQAMSASTSRYQDTAAMDFINLVQAETVKAALVGTPQEGVPVLSIAAPFNKDAAIPAGQVTVRDVAGLYIFDNTLLGIQLTGAQVKDYLETSAAYFKQVSGTGPFPASAVTNAVTPTAPNGTPDYNYDIMGGLDARLTYDIDISKAPGSRISALQYDGVDVEAGDPFVIAINNYRQSGGGNFPHVKTAPVLYNRTVEIRQLMIDWVTANKVIDPPAFFTVDWRLTSGGTPITITA
jgi:2',3'-cyclic-nucleotide 2'-phosphodiesterase / 3'-nucleotidase